MVGGEWCECGPRKHVREGVLDVELLEQREGYLESVRDHKAERVATSQGSDKENVAKLKEIQVLTKEKCSQKRGDSNVNLAVQKVNG